MVEKQLAFLRDYPSGIYRMIFDSTLDSELNLNSDAQERFRRNVDLILLDHERGYIQTPQQFFEKWLDSRSGKGLHYVLIILD